MFPRAAFITGAILCVSMLWWVSRSGTSRPGAEIRVGEAVAVTVDQPIEDHLVEVTSTAAVSVERVDVLEAQPEPREAQARPVTWLIQFTCSSKDLSTPLPSRLDVALEGPLLTNKGTAHRRKGESYYSRIVHCKESELQGATLFVATTKRALDQRDGSPFRWREKFQGYRLGRASLASASWDHETDRLLVPHIELLPPKFLGNVLLGSGGPGFTEFLVWTQPDVSTLHSIPYTLPFDRAEGGNKLPFAAFVPGGYWGAGDHAPDIGDQFLLSFSGSPVGVDVYLNSPRAVLELTLNLVSLPDARSILIREAASGVPSALTLAELAQRATSLGTGVTTLSDKAVRNGQQEALPLGKTTLPSGEYAVEAWSKPDSAGLTRLVASKTIALTVGTHKLTLR